MKRCRAIVGLLVILVMGMYLVTPAKDLPQTRYDESRKLPYEINPVSATHGLHLSARVPRNQLKSGSTFSLDSLVFPFNDRDASRSTQQARTAPPLLSDPSPTIRYHALRC